jgi:hypothetical protein
MTTKIRQVLSADSITGTTVQNLGREDLGEIKDLMIDLSEGRIAYAVLSFGGFLGMETNSLPFPGRHLTSCKMRKSSCWTWPRKN